MPAVVEPDEARAIGEAGSSQPSDADRTRTEAKRDAVSQRGRAANAARCFRRSTSKQERRLCGAGRSRLC